MKRTKEVAVKIMTQSENFNGTTLKHSPPNSTIIIWPVRIIAIIMIKPLHPLILNADWPDANALALNILKKKKMKWR